MPRATLASVCDTAAPRCRPHLGISVPAGSSSPPAAARSHRAGRALTALRALGWPAFAAGDLEDPRGAQLPGAWHRAAAHNGLVAPEPSADALLARWLDVGGYRLYLARVPVDAAALPGLFRAPPQECFDACAGLGIVALLDSFPDDRERRILVQPAAENARIAA